MYVHPSKAGPDGPFVSTGACRLEVPDSNPGRAGYLSSWLCIYSSPNSSKAWWSVQPVHWKEPLKSFEIKVGHSPGFGFPSVTLSTRKTQHWGEPPWPRDSVLSRQDPNFESCDWRAVSFHSSHHPQEFLLAQFSLYVHKGNLKPHFFHFLLSRYCHDCAENDVKQYSHSY